jgi:CheY-like chemotaxis protein
MLIRFKTGGGMAEARKFKVLVIDDDELVLHSLERIVAKLGYPVKGAICGQDAINACKDEQFDLAFLDMRMPGLNGYETMIELKKIMPKCKYAAMTGYDVDEIAQQAQDAGVCALLKKPFEISQISEVIAMVKGTIR